ncbi:hypothetical protein M0R45_031690 [Rubus argutus]|uniref:ABC transporter domain-containing protein n=1 Tax=Rubus argutus TaxID=59490 RepID=A0AAW1WH71_RUBAR
MATGEAYLYKAGSSLQLGSSSMWRSNGVEACSRSVREDEEALIWAALEKLPTYDRLRKGILTTLSGKASEIDVPNLGFQEREQLVDRLLKVPEEDNERFLLNLKNRIDRVGIDLPTIEVRFENLNVGAETYVGARAMPTILNFTFNLFQGLLNGLCIRSSKKTHLRILQNINGIIKPSRMTLLLGPPSCGKTTLLLALAGKLDPDLKLSGRVTYNGHGMNEFIPQKTSAYISQHDSHIGEMTVRETLAFSARCQGVGTRYDLLAELCRREKAANIKPDPDLDVFMKGIATEGQEVSVVTDYILKVLGLEGCADTIIGDQMLRGISGGQRKRVTTGEMLVGPAKGPREHVLEFFETKGFKCPERKGIADFLQEVTSKKDQQQYWKCKDEPYSFVTRNSFVYYFKLIQISFMAMIAMTLFLQVASWVFITYYVIGFDPNVGRFIKQYTLLVLVGQMASALFRMDAAICRNMIVANTLGSFIVIIFLTLGGFILSRDDIKKWWTWGYWMSPMMYGQNAIVVIELLGNSWRHVPPDSTMSLGVAVLKSRGFFPHAYWYWIGVVALIGYVLLFNIGYTVALSYLNPLGRHQSVNSEDSWGDAQEDSSSQSAMTVKHRTEIPVETTNSKRRGMVLPFEPHSMTFDEVGYSVDMPQEMKIEGVQEDKLVLLKGVSGSFRPGVLTALMGALLFSAWLRLPPEVNSATRKMFTEEVMELVELNPLRQSLVGLPGVDGLSTEQRKRLTIAVELVANPSIIFMDEPTSGLDARAAAIVMRTVRNTVDTGRTVVCTIHQPSIDIFESFDELLLLKRGGQEVYVGPLGRHSCHLIKYFERIGVNKISDGYNPATWMLEVTAPGQELALGIDFTDVYKNSELYRRNKQLITEFSTPAPSSEDLYFPTQYSQPFLTQSMACLWKQHWSYWRNPLYTAVRLLFTTFIALLFGTMFWNLGFKLKKEQDLYNAMGAMFTAVLFLGLKNATSVQPVVDVERTVFYREKAAGMYGALAYAFAQVLIELPYCLVQASIYGIITYLMMGFERTFIKFFWYLYFIYFTMTYFTLYGMMAVGVTPNAHIASITSSGFYALWNIFSGYLMPRPRMAVWWRWYYWASPIAWTFYGLNASQYGDVQDRFEDGIPVQQFLRDYFGYRHDFVGVAAMVHVGFVVLFGFCFAFSIRVFNFQRR